MKIFFLAAFVFFKCSVIAQIDTWKSAKDWRLYKLQGNDAFRCPNDSLMFKESSPLDKDSLIRFLRSASACPKDKYSLWMGSYLISFEDENNNVHKIDVSMYGGFFFDEQLQTYYQVTSGMKNDWMEFMNDNYEKLLSHE